MPRADVVESLARRIDIWRKEPWRFPRDMHGVDPSAQQDQVLHELHPGAHISIASGHGVGKTALLAWIVEWSLICWNDVKCPCTAPTKSQMYDALWAELRKWIADMLPGFRDILVWHPDHIEMRGVVNRTSTARTARKEAPESLQGIHASHVTIIIDEASGIPEPIFEAGRGSLSTRGSIVVMASNPTRTTGYFHDSQTVNAERWTTFRFDSRESPFVDPDFVREIIEDYGEDSDMFRVRVQGLFPRQDICQMIPRELIEQAVGKVIHPRMILHAPRVFGLDVAWEGDDRIVLVERQGLASSIQGEWDEMNLQHLAGIVAQKEDERKVKATFVDVGAMGPGVIDSLRALGHMPIPINFGGKPRNPYYADARTEMWGGIKKWLEAGGSIPNHKRLIADLAGPMYSWLPGGAMKMESKKDMKRRGLKSPDYGDAYGLTHAQPVASEIDPQVSLRPRHQVAVSDYDVLDMRR